MARDAGVRCLRQALGILSMISCVTVLIAYRKQPDRLQPRKIIKQGVHRVSRASGTPTALAASYVTNAEERCVDGAVAAFGRIDHHGEPMGFNVDQDLTNPSQSAHWQSIARHPYSGNFFYLSKNGVKGIFHFDSEAGLAVVRFSSDESNLARRSNLHRFSRDFQNSAPPTGHRIEDFLDVRFGYDHLGGMQAAGDLLAISYEQSTTGEDAMAAIFDIRVPDLPVRLSVETADSNQGGLFVPASTMGAVGIFTDGVLASGARRYVVLASFADADRLRLWSLAHDPANASVVSVLGAPLSWRNDGPSFQNLQLVKDCSGDLYAIGIGRRDSNSDAAYLYRLNVERNANTGSIDSFGGLDPVAALQMSCTNAATDGEKYCDFKAGAGIYVDPQGTLSLYGVEHDNDGEHHSTKVTEFWDRGGNRDRRCDAEGAWVTLYRHVNFGGQTLTMTHFNEVTDDFDNFTKIPWNDHASSVRACLPAGCSVELCKHTSFRDCIALNGPALETTTGLVSDSNLHRSNMGDEVSSARFVGACGPIGGWATGEPNDRNGEDCVEILESALLNDVSCSQLRHWACQSMTDPAKWIRSDKMSIWSAVLACPVGYAFTYPKDAAEQQALAHQVRERVWVNLTDAAQEGRFLGGSLLP